MKLMFHLRVSVAELLSAISFAHFLISIIDEGSASEEWIDRRSRYVGFRMNALSSLSKKHISGFLQQLIAAAEDEVVSDDGLFKGVVVMASSLT